MTDYRHLPMGEALSDGTNNYTVEKILGSGGFGITYLAKDEKLGRKVAIKEYYPGEFAGRDTTRSVVPITVDQAELFAWGKERFLDEARMLAGFDHPNLLGVLGYFETNNTAYMVLPYIEGKTLGQRYKDKLLTEEEARKLMLQLVDGLKQVHDKGVLHRDIKPANIILTGPEETPVLIDFGAARSALGQKSNSLTAIVSAPYSPREQYTTVLEQTPSTDIYSLGATIYRAMFGSGPPEAIVRDEVIELTELENSSKKGGISSQFERALRNTLEFRVANRPASVDQLLDMVELEPASSSNTESDQSSRQTDFTIADEKTKKKNTTANYTHHTTPISPRPPPKSALQQKRKRLALVALPVFVVVVYLFAVAFDDGAFDGKLNEQGTRTYANGDKYVGEFKNSKKSGRGTYTSANGDKYVGEFKDDKRNGQFTVTYANGDKYVGEYKNGKQNGQGTRTFASGDKYVGKIKDGEFNGQGTYTSSANGYRYVGEWKDGSVNGQFTVTYDDGEKYVGEFNDEALYHGQGTLTFASGDKYVGEFKDGKRHGHGTLTRSFGSKIGKSKEKYVGEFKNSLFNGRGTLTRFYDNEIGKFKEKYVGEFKNGKRHGQGTRTDAEGGEYVGEFKDDYPNGQGTYTYPDGEKYVGEWKDGMMVNGNYIRE